jgi:hypothetical protein
MPRTRKGPRLPRDDGRRRTSSASGTRR